MTQLVEGALAQWLPGFTGRLADLGYSPGTTRQQLGRVARLSKFLQERELSVAEMGPEVMEQFLATSRWSRPPTARSLSWMVEYLKEAGVKPAPSTTEPTTPEQLLLERFRAYLLRDRGAALDTTANYRRAAGRFLAVHPVRGLGTLTAVDVSTFMTSQSRKLHPEALQRLATGLRSFLNFAFVDGIIERALTDAVPSPARWSVTGLPRGLSASQVTALLASCDRRRPLGSRNYAILLLLTRLGLRAAEVAGLRLDDIDWRAGEIVLRGKGRRADRLPLPPDVGAAIADYVQRHRPQRPEREVFLRSRAPLRGLTSDAVSQIVRVASEQVGVGRFGAHRLRHTAATQMLRAGASLPEVAQVLRHRVLVSTALYAKVDHHALRPLAMPWPGSAR